MSKNLTAMAFFICLALFFVYTCTHSLAQQDVISALSNNGEKTIYGSILTPTQNEVNIPLTNDLFKRLKKAKSNNTTVLIASVLDSTQTFSIPFNLLKIQKRTLSGTKQTVLVINLFDLTTQSGLKISPSALQSGDYNVKISGDAINITTASFNYQTPVLIVGKSDSTVSGVVHIEDLNGTNISDTPVTTKPDGSFITEVRSNKIPANSPIGVVHIISNSDQFAIIPLINDITSNERRSGRPVFVNEGSTFAALLAKETTTLASKLVDVEKEKLLASPEIFNETISPLGCNLVDIGTCTTDFSLLGTKVKQFLQTAQCTFKEFQTIKDIVLVDSGTTNSQLGTGYCAFANRNINAGEACTAYRRTFNSFKDGTITELPCPPDHCTEFKKIRPPKCTKPTSTCEENNTSAGSRSKICTGSKCKTKFDNCVHTARNLFCAKIGTDIPASACKAILPFEPEWTIVKNAQSDEFCVQSGIPTTADECALYECHKKCEEDTTSPSSSTESEVPNFQLSTCSSCECHFRCDAEAGRSFKCFDPFSDLFGIKCCDNVLNTSIPSPDTDTFRSPIPQDVRGCLCSNTNNFDNQTGLVKPSATQACTNNCPEGYTKDPDSDLCLPDCIGDFVKSPDGGCIKFTCSKNFIPNPKWFEANQLLCICPNELPLQDSNGVCVAQCPNGTEPSTSDKSSLPQGTPTLCVPENSNTCTADTPNLLNGNCVKTCPEPLSPGISASNTSPTTQLECLCPNLTKPDINGNCVTEVFCSPTQFPGSIDSCTCAPGAEPKPIPGSLDTENALKTCQCNNGNEYTTTGCGEDSNAPKECCQYFATFNNQTLQCNLGTSFAHLSNNDPNWCLDNGGVLTQDIQSCNSAPSVCCSLNNQKVKTSEITCLDQKGTVLSCDTSECDKPTITICEANEESTVSNPCTCADGASLDSNNQCVCSNGGTYSKEGCTTPPPQTITLNSVLIKDKKVTVDYSKTFNTCAHLFDSNLKILHKQNHFCQTSGEVTVPLSKFKSPFKEGIQVKLCHGNNANICSDLVQVVKLTSKAPTCVPGQHTDNPSRPCQCAESAAPKQVKRGSLIYSICACKEGFVYFNSSSAGGSICRRYCEVRERFSSNNPCTCGARGTFSSGNGCSCSNGNTYNSDIGCGADEHI